MNPRVVYDGLDFGFFLDPKYTQNYKTSTSLFFTSATIDGNNVDFQGYYDTTSTITANTIDSVRGVAK